MTLGQLRMLLEVGALGGFSRAARSLRRSQPGVSQAIAALEEELGVTLVRRARARVTLTEAGQRVAARARAVLDGVEDIRATASAARGIDRGTLRLGVLSGQVLQNRRADLHAVVRVELRLAHDLLLVDVRPVGRTVVHGPPVRAAPFEVSVLSRDGVSFEHDLIVGAAADAHALTFQHESLTEEIRLLRVDNYEAVVPRLSGLVVELSLDDLSDSRLFVEIAGHAAEPGLESIDAPAGERGSSP